MMLNTRTLLSFALAAAFLIGATPTAQSEDKTAPKEAAKGLLRLLPADVTSERSINFDGKRFAYRVVAGTLPIFATSGDQKAAIFYTAYTLPNADHARRPLTFVFNGGPGAASAFLHLGLAGPRIADFGPSGREGAAATLRDNPETWLAFTDLVFVDPIGTGWSRTDKFDDAKEYWSVNADAQVMAKTIALYVAHNARGASPKYLLGESYGGFRAAKVARVLQQDQGIVASGIVMLSPLLESGYTFGGDRLSLGCALQLPSIVAAELESKHALTLDKLADAERFAMTDYLTTLAGAPPKGDAARVFYGRIAEMTGLPADIVEKARGCVRDAYLNHRRDRTRQSLSAYDASFGVDDPFPDSDRRRTPDPVLDGFVRALGGLFADYARNELGFKTDMTYSLLAGDVGGSWDWGRGGRSGGQGVSDDIRELLSLNPSFRLLVAHGNADLITPHMVSRYVLDHIPQIGGPERVQLKVYSGGHMFYLADPSRVAFSGDARAFFQRAE